MPPMDFYGNLGNSKLSCYLFVHEPRGDQSQYVPLAGCQGLEKAIQVRDDFLNFPPLAVPFNRLHHSVQHVLVSKRCGQEIDCAAFHCPDGHGNVAVASHEDDWDVNVRLGHFGLKVEATQSW